VVIHVTMKYVSLRGTGGRGKVGFVNFALRLLLYVYDDFFVSSLARAWAVRSEKRRGSACSTSYLVFSDADVAHSPAYPCGQKVTEANAVEAPPAVHTEDMKRHALQKLISDITVYTDNQ
jgi:hypothetical protein